ncbi:MAG: hypothetical protein H6Q69_4334 [Firmicutes bacterium]|nr:hypothetical protein [Bacillota bacterium]
MGGYTLVSIRRSKRNRNSRRRQRVLTAKAESIQPRNQQRIVEMNIPIRSIVTGQWMEKGDVLHDWQEFVLMRQEKLEGKLQFGNFSSEYTTIMNQVDQLLEGQPEKVDEAVTQLVVTATYMHYNKGFLDGMKIGMVMGNV